MKHFRSGQVQFSNAAGDSIGVCEDVLIGYVDSSYVNYESITYVMKVDSIALMIPLDILYWKIQRHSEELYLVIVRKEHEGFMTKLHRFL